MPSREYVCHGRNPDLVEFQILLAESPVGVSTKIKVESPVRVVKFIRIRTQ